MTILKVWKKKVRWEYSQKIKDMYYSWITRTEIASRTWYTIEAIKVFLDGKSTANYTKLDWTKLKRCSICRNYRELDLFRDNNKLKIKACECKYCYKVICKNVGIMNRNLKRQLEISLINKSSRTRNSWRYKTKRKVIRILNKTTW